MLITISGDRGRGVIPVEGDSPIATLLGDWAAHYSTLPAAELVVINTEAGTIVDPATTLVDLRLGVSATLRLANLDEAAALLGAVTATVEPADVELASAVGESAQRPGPGPRDAGHDSPRPLRVVDASSPAIPSESARPVIPTEAARPVIPTESAPPVPEPRPWVAAGEAPTVPVSTAAGGRSLSRGRDIPAPTTGRWRKAAGAALSRRPEGIVEHFAIAERPGPATRFRGSLRATDRRQVLESIIRRATLLRCVVIVVVSPKGGVGKSSIAALLGTLFAELRRDPVLAVDANPDFGNLASKLSVDRAHYVDEVAYELHQRPSLTPAQLAGLLGSGPHGLRFLATPTDPPSRMVQAASRELYAFLLGRLRDFEGLIIVDCGTGFLDPPAQAALQAADQVVLVTDTSAGTAQLVVSAAAQVPASTPIQLVANRMSRGAKVDLDQVRAAVPNVGGLTIIPEVRLTENVIVPSFDWTTAPPGFQLPVRELAARLALGWR